MLNRLVARLPLQLRVLCRQFLLRVIDLEALSIHADVTGYLGQFAGIAIMLSAVHSLVAWAYLSPMKPDERLGYAWHFEQYLIATMMLATGLFAVVNWEAAFPDRRDIMILSPLPIRPRTILIAKLATSGAILGMMVLALNVFCGVAWPFAVGMTEGSWQGFFRAFGAYWFTMAATTVFLFCSVLTAQGLAVLVLPRRISMWGSALLQLVCFGAFFGTYFLQGTITSPAAMAAPQNRLLLEASPSFWFFALFNQMNGTLPPSMSWLARRAWIGLGVSMVGTVASLLLCYLHTMRRTVEQPDLLPGVRRARHAMRLGSGLQTAVLQFTLRTLARSRQHRIILAFYLSIAFAMALGMARKAIAAGAQRPVSSEFLILTSIIMIFAVMGFANVFSLPISLTANWVLRITQIRPTRLYISATANTLLLLSVLPAWLISAALGLTYTPRIQVLAHLTMLALFGFILAEASRIGFHRMPFTCSLLPGNTNLQFVFWKTIAGIALMSVFVGTCEMPALRSQRLFSLLICGMIALAAGLWAFNGHQARSAVLYYEELPEVVITTLGLVIAPKSVDETE
jgi:hypothetical protein